MRTPGTGFNTIFMEITTKMPTIQPKPSLFIGSSTESLEVAFAAQENLDSDAEVTVWSQGIFDLSRNILESLLDKVGTFDFSIFIFSPDDRTRIRGQTHNTVRDNVVFELGLFMGRAGRDRSFVFIQQGELQVHLLTDLLGLVPATYNPNRTDGNLEAALGAACNKVRRRLRKLGRKSEVLRNEGADLPYLVPRQDFTKYLAEHLSDEATNSIRIVTYTSEVDVALLDRFHIKGIKKIEIYKRSILSDLAEQQETNIRRLAAGRRVKMWDKRKVSMNASRALAKKIPAGSTLDQYFYDAPPSKRAYIFGSDEAIVTYYEVADDELATEGSVYKGITDSAALLVNRNSAIGNYMIDELESHLAGLRRVSRTWEQEHAILQHRGTWRGYGRRPCVEPRVVCFDLDGTLLDSMPSYVQAWKSAFARYGFDYPEREVYLQEGRPGKEAIRLFLDQRGEDYSEELIEEIRDRRNEALRSLRPARAQEGAIELVSHVVQAGLKPLVVTGSSRKNIAEDIERVFGDLFDPNTIVSGQETYSSKPNPEPYLLACNKAEVFPHEAIGIENSPLGIQSADSAGLFCLAINTGILTDKELEAEGARTVFSSCAELTTLWPMILDILRS